MNKLKGWKTVIFNLLAAVMPVLEIAGADMGLEGNALKWYLIAVTVINLVLRKYTDTPIGKKVVGSRPKLTPKSK